MKKLSVIASTAFLAMLPASAAFAGDANSCKEFTIYSAGETSVQQHIDSDRSGGNSAGDRLVGFRVLQDADGNRIGERYFTGLIHEVDSNGEEVDRTTEIVVVLKTGALYITKDRISDKKRPLKVIGGTGEFVGISGTEKSSREGTVNVYHYRLNCAESS